MGNFMKNPIVFILLLLAGVGLVNELLFNTSSFLKNLILIAIFSVILFGIFRFIQGRGSQNNRNYRKALKQSKKLYGKNGEKKIRRKRSHLTVIDGKKDKKKNGAV